jgi:hypothetical protein
MKNVMLAAVLVFVPMGVASAATLVNKDGQAQVVVVTENGDQRQVAIEAGGSAEVCPSGCFITMPSGDRETLAGGETVEIINGSAVIK